MSAIAERYYELIPILIEGLKKLKNSPDAQAREVAYDTLKRWDEARNTDA